MAAETITDRIEQDAINGVQKIAVDGQSVESMTIDDRIKADQYVESKKLAKKYPYGIRMKPLTPGGCG